MITQKRTPLTAICIALLSLLISACSTPSQGTASLPVSTTSAPAETQLDEVVQPLDESAPAPTEDVTVAATVDEATDSGLSEAVDDEEKPVDEEIIRPDGWTEASHSNDVDPDYTVVFPQEQVNSMTIVIDSADWQFMLDNMTEILGEPTGEVRGGAGGGQGGAGGNRPPGGGGGNRPEGGGRQGGGQGGPRLDVGGGENPEYVAATIEFEGNVWNEVGVRFKGNSTLSNAWNSKSLELPFKLDFDEFEDDYPEIDDQRFYGFKQLSLSNPGSDASYVRAAMAYDILQDTGLIAPETAWYELYVDYGEGPVSFGLYTVIEVIDDTVIKTALGDDDGNIYEGDGTAATLAEGTFEQLADSFQKENNEEADYSDLEALYTVLHADSRLSDADQWRSDLEAIFDVDTFLKWLAVNSTIVNWDTYGQMSHNFYLYHDSESDLLTWIGWDYNEALQPGRRGGTASLDQTSATDEWPLIRYLLDQPTYYAQYAAHVAEIDAGAFDVDTIEAQLTAWETLLAPHVPDSALFAAQIDTVSTFVNERQSVVAAFIQTIK